MLERREQIVEVRRRLLRPGLRADGERGGLARARGEAGGKLAVAAIEEKDGSAGAEPQHIDEIVRLLGIKFDLGLSG